MINSGTLIGCRVASTLLLLMLGFIASPSLLAAPDTQQPTAEMPSHESHNHGNHSDALLLLIADKLALQKLQKSLPDLQKPSVRQQNLAEQKQRLNRSLQRLKHYSRTPEGHYVNLELYQQSLENRASMLLEFAQLLQTYHQQHDLDQITP